MSAGYIYILINKSLDGLIKIGSTTLGAEKRVKQLSSSTGVPTPFIVAYESYVNDCVNFEKQIHDQLSEFRANPNREFFRYPLYKAIGLIQNLNKMETDTDVFEAIEILSLLSARYGNNIKSYISSIRVCQDNERVYLEFTENRYMAGYLKNQIINRIDLGFIVGDYKDKMFDSKNHIRINVNKFLDLDDYSILNSVCELFTKEWVEKQLTGTF